MGTAKSDVLKYHLRRKQHHNNSGHISLSNVHIDNQIRYFDLIFKEPRLLQGVHNPIQPPWQMSMTKNTITYTICKPSNSKHN